MWNSKRSSTYTKVNTKTKKQPTIDTTGDIEFQSAMTTLSGMKIRAKKVANNVDGEFNILAAKNTQTIHTETIKQKRVLFLSSKSKTEYDETRASVVPSTLAVERIEVLGSGTVDFESVMISHADMYMTKNLVEKSATEDVESQARMERKGWFAPRIKGDPMLEAIKNLGNTKAVGDIIPNVFNAAGAGFQTLSQLITVTHLSAIGHPILSVTQIILSRFSTGVVYSNIKQTVTSTESTPIQSHIELGKLSIRNDHTHLEGTWHADTAEIETGMLTTSAQQHAIHRTAKTSGWTVSLSPAAIVGAMIAPIGGLSTVVSLMPSIARQNGKSSVDDVAMIPMTLFANEIFIRCYNAVFRGSQIIAKAVSATVSETMTIESLTNILEANGRTSDIGISTAAAFGAVTDANLDKSVFDHKLGGIPNLRVENIDTVRKHLKHVATMVGTELFILSVGEWLLNRGAQVGLRPDGIIHPDTEEGHIEAKLRFEEKVEEVDRNRQRVINPSIGEWSAMIGQWDALKTTKDRLMKSTLPQPITPQEIDTIDKETKEIFDRPEVKQSFEMLALAKEKMEAATDKVVKLIEHHPDVAQKVSTLTSQPADIFNKSKEYHGTFFERLSKSWKDAWDAVRSQDDGWSGDVPDAMIYIGTHHTETVEHVKTLWKQYGEFAEHHPKTAFGLKIAMKVAIAKVASESMIAYRIAKAVHNAAKTFKNSMDVGIDQLCNPGGLTLATPNGPALVGAMDAAPAAVGAGAAAAQIPATITTAVAGDMIQDHALSRKGDGKGATRKAQNTEKSQPAKRKSDTPEMRNNFVKSKVASKEWTKVGERSGRVTFEDKDNFYQTTVKKSEIEVYNNNGKHIGVIKPSDGILRTDLAVKGRELKL